MFSRPQRVRRSQHIVRWSRHQPSWRMTMSSFVTSFEARTLEKSLSHSATITFKDLSSIAQTCSSSPTLNDRGSCTTGDYSRANMIDGAAKQRGVLCGYELLSKVHVRYLSSPAPQFGSNFCGL